MQPKINTDDLGQGLPPAGVQFPPPRRSTRGGRPTPQAMAHVRRTAAMVADRPVALAEAFYRHLFDMAPTVRGMFPNDMTAQNERLCRALLEAIRVLVEPEHAGEMERQLAQLGAQHAHRYGVVPEHYPYVGHAIVRAVRELTGDRSVAVSSAWVWVYQWLSDHMLSGSAASTGRRRR